MTRAVWGHLKLVGMHPFEIFAFSQCAKKSVSPPCLSGCELMRKHTENIS